MTKTRLWVALAILFTPAAVRAGSVKGTVQLPEGERSGRVHAGYWRLENGNVPVQSAPRPGTMVVLEGLKGARPPAAKTVTVELNGLDAQPKLVVIGPGSVVEFKNSGKVAHELSTPAQPSLMSIERLNPGTMRRQKFGTVGGYLVRCAEYPHLSISVLVTDSPYFAPVDERGAFAIAGMPDGRATLKIWSRGRWVHEEPIETTQTDLTIKVAASKDAKEAAE